MNVWAEPATASWLLCRVGDRSVAVPLDRVVETMRPLPVRVLPGLPRFVSGVSVIRGAVVPVVRLATLLGGSVTEPARYVTVANDGRTVALAVDEVVGVHALDGVDLHEVPPLVSGVDGDALAAVGRLDVDLLLVLETARLVPDEVWSTLPAEA